MKHPTIKRIGRLIVGSIVLCLFFPLSLYLPTAEPSALDSCVPRGKVSAAVLGMYVLCLSLFAVACTRHGGAVVFLISTVFYSAYLGLIFFGASLAILVCENVLAKASSLGGLFMVVSLPIVGVLTFLLHGKARLESVVAVNPQAFNMADGFMSISTSLRRTDGKRNLSTANYIGIGLVAGAIGTLMTTESHLPLILCGWFLGLLFLGTLPIYQLYLAWIVSRDDRQRGRRVLLKEVHFVTATGEVGVRAH